MAFVNRMFINNSYICDIGMNEYTHDDINMCLCVCVYTCVLMCEYACACVCMCMSELGWLALAWFCQAFNL